MQPHSSYTTPPDALRVRAVQRRASVTPAVARAIADMAFRPDRDRTPVLPVILTSSPS